MIEYNIYIAVIAIVLILLVYTLLHFPALHHRKQYRLAKELEEIQSNPQHNALQAQLEIKEQTLSNISREIHDNIGHVLALVKLHLGTIQIRNNPMASNRLHQSMELLDRAVNDLRDLSQSMRGANINKAGLVEAIHNDLNIIRCTGQLSTTAKVYGNPIVLGLAREIVIYRIVQEALSNVIRHAKATEVIVILNFRENDFQVSIIDNGCGFNREELLQTAHGGAGLGNMYSRAQMIGGVLHIDTRPGCGTNVNFRMPVEIGESN